MLKKWLFLAYSSVGILVAFILLNHYKSSEHYIHWADKVSEATIKDSWGTWKTHFSYNNPEITYENFLNAVNNGEYKTISINDFLALKVENQRLEKYINAKTAQEAYPPEDRPRHEDDISSVNYFLQTDSLVSPIIVARVHKDNAIHYIKLDGVHRLIAAAIKKSPIKILFIDL
jgi:hypothetical protein